MYWVSCRKTAVDQSGSQQEPPARRTHQESGRESGVHQRDFKRQPIDPGQGGDPRKRGVGDLRGPQQIPWKTDQISSKQFDRNPQERRQKQGSAAITRARAGGPGNQRGEDRLVQTDIQGKKQQQYGRDGAAQAPVIVHYRKHPITATEVNDGSAHPAQNKCLANRRGRKDKRMFLRRATPLHRLRVPARWRRLAERGRPSSGNKVRASGRREPARSRNSSTSNQALL